MNNINILQSPVDKWLLKNDDATLLVGTYVEYLIMVGQKEGINELIKKWRFISPLQLRIKSLNVLVVNLHGTKIIIVFIKKNGYHLKMNVQFKDEILKVRS